MGEHSSMPPAIESRVQIRGRVAFGLLVQVYYVFEIKNWTTYCPGIKWINEECLYQLEESVRW